MLPEYDANQIQILEGLEAVRKRPSMYVGSTSEKGLHHLVYEIIDNAVDESLAGHCSEIDVIIHNDGSISVKDNGRGIPIGIQEQKGIPAVDVVFTILHAGGKFGGSGYKVSGGLHGVGAAVVNALSEWLTVDIYIDNKHYTQRYERGKIVSELKEVSSTHEQGTSVRFMPDTQIFEVIDFDFDTLKQRFQETAFLTKGLKISISDERTQPVTLKEFHYEGGISEFVEHINRSKTAIHDKIFYIEATKDGILTEIAFQYNDGYAENIYSYVNNINTSAGGTHVIGFKAGLTKTLNDYGKKNNLLKEDERLSGDDVREGMTTVISIKIMDPQFEGQTKTKLSNSEARTVVESVFAENLTYFLEENPDIGKMILEKGLVAARARDAAKKARELVRRKNVLENSRLPGKLADCSDKNPENCEIYIVEGNSAGGSAKQARSPLTQAILPLRGKIMNVEKARIDKILSSEEIKNMITAFGTGIEEDFDIEKLRYHKIILMTDADVDGAHIRTLLLTFLYRYMLPLIEEGKIYIAQPPLYKVVKNRKEYYAYDDKELETLFEEIGRDGKIDIQRYKGLGEMDATQLWDTTMDPEKRILLQVKLDNDNIIFIDEIFSQLMGDKVEPRREFIQERAKFAKNIDY